MSPFLLPSQMCSPLEANKVGVFRLSRAVKYRKLVFDLTDEQGFSFLAFITNSMSFSFLAVASLPFLIEVSPLFAFFLSQDTVTVPSVGIKRVRPSPFQYLHRT